MSADDLVVWWTAFGAIAQALGAIATFAAVAISLWVVLSERALRAEAQGRLLVAFAGDGSPGVYYVGITVENTGLRPIKVTDVGWRTGWVRWAFDAIRYRYAIQNPAVMLGGDNNFPKIIDPSHRENFLTKVADMQMDKEDGTGTNLFKRKFLSLNAPIRVLVSISGRKPVLGRVSADLKEFLHTGNHVATTFDDTI